jgi:hypothetical protein
MPNGNSRPWRALALRANVHLAMARLLLDMALDEAQVPDDAATQLRSAQTETIAAQDLVREIAGGAA